MKRVVCLWLPRWPIQRLCARQPDWLGKPLVLHAPDGRRGSRVVCCSPAAEQFGIRVGMPLPEAQALCEAHLRQGQTVVVHRFSAEEDRAALEELARFCHQFTPHVGYQTLGPDGTWCMEDGLLWEVSRTAALWGGEAQLVEEAARAVYRRWKYRGCWAVGPTVAAAWAWARYGPAWHGGERGMPCGSLEAPSSASALGALPVQALRLTPQIEECLQTLGIHRIDQLAALATDALAARWGPLPAQRLRQLRGDTPEAIVPVGERDEWVAEWSWEFPTASRIVVQQIVDRLLEQLARKLASRQLGALELEVELDCQAAARSFPLRICLCEPTAQADHWQQLARMQFEQAPLPAAVHRVRVQVLRTARLAVRSGALFPGGSTVANIPNDVASLVDRLTARLGPEAVRQPYLRDDPQPEYAYGARPVRATAWRSSAQSAAGQVVPPAMPRPLYLYQPPVPLEVMAVVPEGPPIRCCSARLQFTVARWWGPERVETGWWRGESVRRDYYHVESHIGQHFWIFRRLGDGRWFLQGEFS